MAATVAETIRDLTARLEGGVYLNCGSAVVAASRYVELPVVGPLPSALMAQICW